VSPVAVQLQLQNHARVVAARGGHHDRRRRREGVGGASVQVELLNIADAGGIGQAVPRRRPLGRPEKLKEGAKVAAPVFGLLGRDGQGGQVDTGGGRLDQLGNGAGIAFYVQVQWCLGGARYLARRQRPDASLCAAGRSLTPRFDHTEPDVPRAATATAHPWPARFGAHGSVTSGLSCVTRRIHSKLLTWCTSPQGTSSAA
jgi:hypothetical protein